MTAPRPRALHLGGRLFDESAAPVEVVVGQGCGFRVATAPWREAARLAAPNRLTVITDAVLPRWYRLSEIMMRRVHR